MSRRKIPICIALKPELLERIESFRDAAAKEAGFRISRVAIIEGLLTKALDGMVKP